MRLIKTTNLLRRRICVRDEGGRQKKEEDGPTVYVRNRNYTEGNCFPRPLRFLLTKNYIQGLVALFLSLSRRYGRDHLSKVS